MHSTFTNHRNRLAAAIARDFLAERKQQQPSTKAEVEERREALLAIIDDGKPMTVRQVFYQATVRGLVEKAETGYAKVQTDLTEPLADDLNDSIGF